MTIDQEKFFREEALKKLLLNHECTRGLLFRSRGKSTTLYREMTIEPGAPPQMDDRVRITHLRGNQYGLSVLLHTGRWEKTPFVGSLEELVLAIATTMQHMVAAWPE